MQPRDWEPLFARYAPLALRLARGIVPHGDQAEDVLQEAARAVLERAAGAGFDSLEHARNYFLRAVHSRALDAVRAGERERVTRAGGSEDPPDRERAVELEEQEARSFRSERLLRGLMGLRPAEREAVRLRYLEGLAFREIAERTGESISTLHGRVQAGLERLRRHLGSG